jgi:glycerate 2-kinase
MKKSKKILIAIDSFKGSLTSKDASEIIKGGLISKNPNLEIATIPIADGGEGTVESFVENVSGEYVSTTVKDPLLRNVNAKYGIIDEGRTAVIEMAAASGLNLLGKTERNPLITSTYGTGELIVHAAQSGVKNIIIGVGGSATNDGGVGMASALGINFLDKDGQQIGIDADSLANLTAIDMSNVDSSLDDVKITVLSDVTNTLLGENGASSVYGPQKGATPKIVETLENNLQNLVRVVKKDLKTDFQNIQGSGASGGLAYGLMTFLNAEIKSGINFIIDCLDIEKKIINADYVITGEGKLDSQTCFNKAPWGIMQLAKKHNKKVIGIAGIIIDNDDNILHEKYDYLYSILNGTVTFEQSMKYPQKYLHELAQHIAIELFV